MNGFYDLGLVAASYAIAVLACYATVDLSTRLPQLDGARRASWLVVGALTLGTGVWSMHFVGMAAYRLPIAMSYDRDLTAISWLIALLGAGLGLHVVSASRVTMSRIFGGGLAMGGSMCLMHYCGMAAMRMTPAIEYDPFLLCLSVTIAVAASFGALFICFGLREIADRWQLPAKLAGAALMGVAICGMHYCGMAAAEFAPGASCAPQNALRGSWMGLPVALSAIGFIAVIVLLSVLDNLTLERHRRIAGERLHAERLRQRTNDLFEARRRDPI